MLVVADSNGVVVSVLGNLSIVGWEGSDLVGKPMSETFIPERYRKDHNAGYSRYRETGESPVLGKRIEYTAVSSAGEELPVYVTVFGRDPGTGYFMALLETR